jgi:hypothetical protein
MKQKTFHSFMLASVISLATGLLVSCEKDLCKDNPSESNSYITFSEPEIENMISTRTLSTVNEAAIPAIVERATLRSEKGDSMRLRVTEEDFFTIRGEKADRAVTRGSLVTSSAGISPFGVSCSVYPAAGTYTNYGCGSYFYKESAAPNAPMDYFWPTSDYKVSFFAYYPYNNAAFTVNSSAAATGSPVYAYTVPSTIANQVDVMTAQVTNHLAGSQGALALTFSHNCAAIKINITNNSGSGIIVNSVAIEGVEYSGTLHDGIWTLSGSLNSSSTNPFSLSYGSSIADGATADITGTSNIFIMLPQTLTSSAKLKIVTTDDTYETAISGSWVAGKTYTYSITKEADGAIDLSMVDNAGNERASMTTANCYLVHAAGKYKIPLVYGNAIKNGTDNRVAYYPGEESSVTNGADQFVNHNLDGITGPWITKDGSGIDAGMGLTATSAELLWQDVTGLISAVSVSGNYLKFTIGTFNPGNALIAVKDGSGNILWSWHIWATEDDLTNTTIISTGDHTYTVAPVNVGWVPISSNGKQGYCPYYQWGRKDPFIPSTGSASTNHTVYNISNSTTTGFTYQNVNTPTIADNIKNPTYYYYNTGFTSPYNVPHYNMWDAQNTSADANIATATKKTIYDPCPPGFCVPTGNLYNYIVTNYSSYFSWDSTNKGRLWSKNSPNVFFPASGKRSGNNDYLGSVGDGGLIWSATPINAKGGRYLYFGSRNSGASRPMWISDIRSCGFSIRAVVEE